jgi:uncharacterized RDD family membrane protein YckC
VSAADPVAGRAWVDLGVDDLVTGEAVALDLPPAGLASRMASGLLDVLVTLVMLLGVGVVVSLAVLDTDDALVWVGVIGSLVTVFLVLPTVVETWSGGRSLGKLALGLRTVRDDGGPITAHHAFVRHLVGFVEIYAFSGAPAFFAALMSRQGKRLGDHAAGTYVVRERVRLELPAPAPMPPALAGWARSADVGSLPAGLTVAVRQYLSRVGQLDPAAAQRVGERLATEVAAYVAPAAPPHTHPASYLAAVLATRRERDTARLEREAAMRRRLAGGR